MNRREFFKQAPAATPLLLFNRRKTAVEVQEEIKRRCLEAFAISVNIYGSWRDKNLSKLSKNKNKITEYADELVKELVAQDLLSNNHAIGIAINTMSETFIKYEGTGSKSFYLNQLADLSCQEAAKWCVDRAREIIKLRDG